VVAEGVETQTQLDKLRAMMCDEMQGFLLGKPMAAEDFIEAFPLPEQEQVLADPDAASIDGP